MRSGDLIREARLRAGLTQYELAERSGRDRSVIARWEQGAVAPSVETLVELVRACGFDLPLELVPRESVGDERLRKNALLSPERRVLRIPARARQSQLKRAGPRLDPYAILTVLERWRVRYVLIGGFARIIEGTDELTHGIDLTPSLRAENLRQLGLALDDLDACLPSGDRTALERDLAGTAVLELHTQSGELKIVPEPAGTRGGYDDLRRAAAREPVGRGLRPPVASIGDLARMLAALGRDRDVAPLRQLRRLAELERDATRVVGR
jgi:transcriptional regulator with XRE-family HTH domain